MLDTNSLQLLYRDKSLCADFIDKLIKSQALLFVSPLVLEEMLDYDGADQEITEGIYQQMLWINQLWSKLSDALFKFVMMPKSIFAAELKGAVFEFPDETTEMVLHYRSMLNDSAATRRMIESRDPKYKSATKFKENILERDYHAKALFTEGIKNGRYNYTPAQLKKLISSYGGPNADSFALEPMLDHLSKNYGCPLVKGNTFLKQKNRYPSLYSWSCLAEITAHGNLIPDEDGSPISKTLRSEKGNWYDNAIASSCSYFDHLISRDKALIDKCELLRNLGHLNFKTISLESWFSETI